MYTCIINTCNRVCSRRDTWKIAMIKKRFTFRPEVPNVIFITPRTLQKQYYCDRALSYWSLVNYLCCDDLTRDVQGSSSSPLQLTQNSKLSVTGQYDWSVCSPTSPRAPGVCVFVQLLVCCQMSGVKANEVNRNKS